MSQVFSADSVSTAAPVTVTGLSEIFILTGNFLSPPFQNAKALFIATANFTAGTSCTSVHLRVHRNPSAENTQVAAAFNVSVTGGNIYQLTLQGADAIPDPRPVQYGLSITQVGASANGTASSANITTMLISG